MSRKGFL